MLRRPALKGCQVLLSDALLPAGRQEVCGRLLPESREAQVAGAGGAANAVGAALEPEKQPEPLSGAELGSPQSTGARARRG